MDTRKNGQIKVTFLLEKSVDPTNKRITANLNLATVNRGYFGQKRGYFGCPILDYCMGLHMIVAPIIQSTVRSCYCLSVQNSSDVQNSPGHAKTAVVVQNSPAPSKIAPGYGTHLTNFDQVFVLSVFNPLAKWYMYATVALDKINLVKQFNYNLLKYPSSHGLYFHLL